MGENEQARAATYREKGVCEGVGPAQNRARMALTSSSWRARGGLEELKFRVLVERRGPACSSGVCSGGAYRTLEGQVLHGGKKIKMYFGMSGNTEWKVRGGNTTLCVLSTKKGLYNPMTYLGGNEGQADWGQNVGLRCQEKNAFSRWTSKTAAMERER